MKDTGLIVDLLDDKLSSDLFNDSFYYNLISRLQNLKHDYIEVDGGSRKTKQRKTNRRRGKTNRRRRKY